MEHHVKVLVFIKTVLLSAAVFFCMWGFYKSMILNMKIRTRGIAYMLTKSAKLYDLLRRISILSLCFLDALCLSAQVNRAMEGFPAYMNAWTEVSSMMISIFLFTNSLIVWIIYSSRITDFLTTFFHYGEDTKSLS